MKASGIVTLSLAALAVAAPAPRKQQANKRDLVWVTETSEVVETVVATTTVYVDAEDVTTTVEAPHNTPTAAPTSVEAAATTQAPASSEEPATTAAPTTTTKEAPAPEPTTESSSTSEYVAPEPTTSETPSSTYVAPTSTYIEPSSTYVAPSSSSAAPAEASPVSKDVVAAESASGEVFNPSRVTYYSPSVGSSSCGPTYSDDSNVVALTSGSMNSGLCNKQITIEVNGNQFAAFIGDTCPGCPSDGSLDITPTLFTKMMGSTDAGVIKNAKWWFN